MAGEDNKTKGMTDQAKGKVQEGMGKLTGNEEQEAKGEATQTGGKARQGVGNLQDAASDLIDDK